MTQSYCTVYDNLILRGMTCALQRISVVCWSGDCRKWIKCGVCLLQDFLDCEEFFTDLTPTEMVVEDLSMRPEVDDPYDLKGKI